jgi:glycosyltransferase involved in cell wall biosynthesis
MKNEIWVAGYPSLFGGADTELDHNIDLWRSHSAAVHLVPLGTCDLQTKQRCDRRGCITHRYESGIFRDKVVVSFCNGEFLKALPRIIEDGRPRLVIWFNCMTWTFPDEITAHRNGWIDYHGFVSQFQRDILVPQLAEHARVTELAGYHPYFSLDNASQQIQFSYREPRDHFAVGRISRDDSGKFASDTWNIFQKVCAPIPTKVFVLGFGENARRRCGTAPIGMDWQAWGPSAIPVAELYAKLHAIIHKTGGSRESYCRIVPEAYAAGVPLIVEDDFAFPELIVDGVTGFLCKSSDEMSFRASELAFDEPRRRGMIFAAREHLLNRIAAPAACWAAWKDVLI